MADHTGNWYPLTNQGVQWDAQGKPYYNTSDGLRSYIPPISAAQYRDDPKMLAWAKAHGASITTGANGQLNVQSGAPEGGFWHGNGEWDSQTGQYDQPFNWGNLLSLGIGGAIAAPLVAGALGGSAAGAGAGSGAADAAGSAAGGVGLGETGAATGLAGSGLGGAAGAGGVGIGETGATTGLAGSGFGEGGGLGLAGTPTVGDLASAGSSIAGQTGAASGGPAWLSTLLGKAPQIGHALSGAATGSAAGRAAAANADIARDAILTNLFGIQSRNAENQAAFQRSAPGAQASQAVRGDILANAKDASFSNLPGWLQVPETQGGLRPSMFSDTTRTLGSTLSKNALSQAQNPTTGGIAYPTAPTINPVPSPSGVETGLGTLGTIANIAGAVGMNPGSDNAWWQSLLGLTNG